MRTALRRLAPGFGLIALASAVLLLSDAAPRGRASRAHAAIAIVQHASTPVLDDGVNGMIQGLADLGLRDGQTATIHRYNAEGDVAVANAIAREIVDGDTDVVITSSTPSLQAVANANRDGRVLHVFAIVADPFAAGIGLDRSNPQKRPGHIAGHSALVPVDDLFRLVKRSFAGLTRVGTAWNPGEPNARLYMTMAREICRELGITLLETSVESGNAVAEAMDSLVGRGAQALWVGGDNVMLSSIDVVVAAGRRGRVPVFTIAPGNPERGTFLDLGVDYYEIGRLAGRLAAEVVQGRDPASVPIRDVGDEVPRLLVVNTMALKGSKDPWRVPADVIASASIVVDESGVHKKPATLLQK